jgi:hypothetical protein
MSEVIPNNALEQDSPALLKPLPIHPLLQRSEAYRRLIQKPWLLAVLFAIVLSDILIYKGGSGWGWAIWATCCAWTLPHARSQRGPWMIAAIAVSLLSLRMAWETTALGAFLTIPLLGLALSRGRIQIFRLPEALCSLGLTPWVRLRLLWHLPSVLLSRGRIKLWGQQLRQRLNQLGAWGIASILALAFLTLIRMGNPILDQALGRLETAVGHHLTHVVDHFENFIPHLMFALLILWWTLCMLFPKLKCQAWRNLCHQGSSTLSNYWPKSIGREVLVWPCLVLFNLVFMLPNACDFMYLWMGHGVPAGVKFVEYAHEGVVWLSLSVLLASLVFALLMPQRLENTALSLKILAGLWILQNTWLGIGAIERLLLYVDYNGLTILRVTGFAGIGANLACLWVVALSRCGERGALWMLRRQALLGFTVLYILVLFPWDVWVARYNVNKILQGMERPSVQLLAQSWGPMASVELLPLLKTENLHIRRGTAALLLNKIDQWAESVEIQNRDWRLKDISTSKALDTLRSQQDNMQIEVANLPLEHHLGNMRRYSSSWY